METTGGEWLEGSLHALRVCPAFDSRGASFFVCTVFFFHFFLFGTVCGFTIGCLLYDVHEYQVCIKFCI